MHADAVHHMLDSMQAKDKMLMETLESISRHRKEKTKAAVERYVCMYVRMSVVCVRRYACVSYVPTLSLAS